MEAHATNELGQVIGDPDVDLDLEDDPEDVNVQGVDVQQKALLVHGGSSLNNKELGDFLKWRTAVRIAVVGDLSSGKSTLLSSIYDQYLRGGYAGLSFVGSLSVVAFEQLVHYSREASGGVVPDTKRTSITDGLSYYHLALTPTGNPLKRVDLMLSDRAGEVYNRVKDNPDSAEGLSELLHADRVLLLLDGAKLIDDEAWANATQGVRQLLRSLLDGGALGIFSNVKIVTTKYDLIESAQENSEPLSRLEFFLGALKKTFTPRLKCLTFSRVSARPADLSISATGLDELLSDWVTPHHSALGFSMRNIELESEFDRIVIRTPI